MGRYKEFLQGRCACHFHEVTQLISKRSASSGQGCSPHSWCSALFSQVEKFWSTKLSSDRTSTANTTRTERTVHTLGSQSTLPDTEQEAGSQPTTYRVRGPVNQVYSEILLSRLCPITRNWTPRRGQVNPSGESPVPLQDVDFREGWGTQWWRWIIQNEQKPHCAAQEHQSDETLRVSDSAAGF